MRHMFVIGRIRRETLYRCRNTEDEDDEKLERKKKMKNDVEFFMFVNEIVNKLKLPTLVPEV